MTRADPCTAAVWVVRSLPAPDPAHLEILTPEERRQCARFRQEERQARFACGRALLRLALAERLAEDPAAFHIEAGVNRRPALAGGSRERWPRVDFNLSSTAGLVACAVTEGGRVGVDVEQTGRGAIDEALMARVVSARERTWLDRSEDPETDFYRLWTLKEAVAKADGEGLGLPFERLTLLPEPAGGLDVDLDAMSERRGDWRIFSLWAGAPAALALRADRKSFPVVDLAPPPPDPERFETVSVTVSAASREATTA